MPYNFMRSHQPLPSVIFRNVPILRLAASIPSVFLSNPETARFSVPLSPSSVLPKCMDCCLSCFAISRRLEVSDSCSLWLCERSASVCARAGSPVVVVGFEGKRELPDAVCTPWTLSAFPLRRSCDARPCAAFWNASLPSGDVVTSMPASAFTLGAYEGN